MQLTPIIEPLIHRGGFPDWVEVHANSIRRRDNRSRDDIVSVEKRSSDGLTDAVDIDGWGSEERGDEAGSCGKQSGEHDRSEPANVEAILGRSDPVGESFPNDGGRFIIGSILLLDEVGSKSGSAEFRGEVKSCGLGHIGLGSEGKSRRR